MSKAFYCDQLNKHLKREMKSDQHSSRKEMTFIWEGAGEEREVWVSKLWWGRFLHGGAVLGEEEEPTPGDQGSPRGELRRTWSV